MKNLGILKEQNGDPRVCMVPQTVKKTIKELGLNVFVERNAGVEAGFTDEMYREAGASILAREDIFKELDILSFINPLAPPLTFDAPKTLIGIMNPLFHYSNLLHYSSENIRLYSLDLVPRSSKAQSMDVLSSMASLAGYKAVIKASELSPAVMPMFTTAAGTIKPAKVLVLGAGVAGLQAIATAKRLGAVVEAFDVRRSAGEEVKSLGAKFIEVEGAQENESAGGYAVEQSEDYLERQRRLIDHHVSQASIVISTANIPGRKAPLLIEQASVEKMQPGSVIIDLASEQGGNCVLTKDQQIVDHEGVKLIGNSFLARELPSTSSQLLSTNYFNFLKHLQWVETENIADDPIEQGCLVISKGKIVSERVRSFIQ